MKKSIYFSFILLFFLFTLISSDYPSNFKFQNGEQSLIINGSGNKPKVVLSNKEVIFDRQLIVRVRNSNIENIKNEWKGGKRISIDNNAFI